MFFMKQLKEDGSFNVVKLDASGRTGDEVLRDHYLADGYADATEEEYLAVVNTSVEEAPVEEAPVEEAPVEEAPVEEAPVE
jgi:hypothetical protein